MHCMLHYLQLTIVQLYSLRGILFVQTCYDVILVAIFLYFFILETQDYG